MSLNEFLHKVALFIDLFVGANMMPDVYVTDIIDILASCYESDITFEVLAFHAIFVEGTALCKRAIRVSQVVYKFFCDFNTFCFTRRVQFICTISAKEQPVGVA